MPTLEDNRLVFRFPQVEEIAEFWIEFQQTLRIPDTDETYPLPPGFGLFPLRHAEDYSARLPSQTVARGGAILPMWQAEAMWLNFASCSAHRRLPFPVAIKIAAGKINAVTGESWRTGLHRDPQDYLVAPPQPWLDGYAIEPGVIRQFVAMPLGDGYTPEEQLTGKAEWGGIQIAVTPLKAAVWQARRRAWEEEEERRLEQERELQREREEHLERYGYALEEDLACPLFLDSTIGLAAGGRMRQTVHPDPFDIADWDTTLTDRAFISLVHAKDWKAITGSSAPHHPPTARDYSAAGLPWFDHYAADRPVRARGNRLSRVRSVATLFKHNTGAPLPDSQDVATGEPIRLGPKVGKSDIA